MSEDHRVLRPDPRLVLESSGVEGGLVDPDEPGAAADQRSEEAGVDHSVQLDVVSLGLLQPLLWLAEPVVQVVDQDRPQLADVHPLADWVLLEEMLLNRGDGLHVATQVLQR